jgi:hypothetical protein
MALPSCNATITLRVTRVRTRVKDHAFKKLKPCRRQIGSIKAVRIPRRSRVVRRKAPAFLGASIPFIKRRGHRGSAQRDRALPADRPPRSLAKVSFSLQMTFLWYCRSFMTCRPLQGACKTPCCTGNGMGPTANHSKRFGMLALRQLER